VTNSSCNKYYSPWQYLVLIPDDDEYSVVQRLEILSTQCRWSTRIQSPRTSKSESALIITIIDDDDDDDEGRYWPLGTSFNTTRPATVISIHHHDISAELEAEVKSHPYSFDVNQPLHALSRHARRLIAAN